MGIISFRAFRLNTAFCEKDQLLNNGVDKYLSPESGSNATIVFPLFSGLLARISAALSAAPDEIPTRIPSDTANALPSANASSFSIVIISS